MSNPLSKTKRNKRKKRPGTTWEVLKVRQDAPYFYALIKRTPNSPQFKDRVTYAVVRDTGDIPLNSTIANLRTLQAAKWVNEGKSWCKATCPMAWEKFLRPAELMYQRPPQ